MPRIESSLSQSWPYSSCLVRRELLGLWALAFACASFVGTHGIAYWDAGDYVRISVEGGVSGLLLGRPLLLMCSRAVAHAALDAGAPIESIEPILRWVWSLVAATAAPLMACLVFRLTSNKLAALSAGFALSVSPSFAHVSHQVLTDGPALALCIAALITSLNARKKRSIDGRSYMHAAASGALLGCAVAMRETALVAAFSIAWLLVRTPGRLVTALLSFVVTLSAIVIASRGGTDAYRDIARWLVGWLRAMRSSSSSHPLALRDVAFSLVWFLSLGPLTVWCGLRGLRALWVSNSPQRQELRAVTVPSLVACVLLFFYPDGAFSPRYFLAVTPLALVTSAAPLLAQWLSQPKRARLVLIALVLPACVAPLLTHKARAIAQENEHVGFRIDAVERAFGVALVAPGHACPAAGAHVALKRYRERRPASIELLCPGWSWPKHFEALAARLDAAQCNGRVVAIDLRDEAWVGPRERAARDAVRKYALQSQPTTHTAGFAIFNATSSAHCNTIRP